MWTIHGTPRTRDLELSMAKYKQRLCTEANINANEDNVIHKTGQYFAIEIFGVKMPLFPGDKTLQCYCYIVTKFEDSSFVVVNL